MAVAHATWALGLGTDGTSGDTNTGDQTFNHAGDAAAKGAVVCVQNNSAANVAACDGVLYGGEPMQLIATAIDTSEDNRVDLYFLGNLTGRQGTQTVTVQNATADAKFVWAATVTASTTGTQIVGQAAVNTTTSSNPTTGAFTLTGGADAWVYGACGGGASEETSYAAGTNVTVLGAGPDFGTRSGRWGRSTALETGATATFAFSYATSDDWCIAAIAVGEYTLPTPTSTSVAQVSLGLGYEPLSRTAHSLKFRGRKQSGTGTVTFRAALYEGANNRSGDLESTALTTSVAEYTLAIADASAANITSYADLELRFWAYSATGDTVTVEVEEAWLETPGALIVTGQAAIAATAGVDAAGTRISGAVTGQASIDATAAVAAVPQRVVQRQVAISASAAIDVTSQRVVQRQVDISATASVAATPQRVVQRQASLDATATVATIPQQILPRQVSVDATASVAAVPQRIVQRQVEVSAPTDVSAAGTRVSGIVTGQASVDATATVAAVPQRQVQRQAAVDATADVQASGARLSNVVVGQASLDATAAVDAAGRVAIHARQASLDATATVQAAGVRLSQVVTGQATISATADVVATPQRALQRQASIDTTAAVDAVPQRTVQRQVVIGAVADVVAVGARAEGLVTGQVALDATADVGAAGARISVTVVGSASVDAVAAVGAIGCRLVMGQAALAATADVVVVPQRELSRAAVVSAAAGVAAAGHGVQLLRPSADSVDGDWTNEVGGTLLAPSVSEPEPNDSDYIHSGPSVPSSCRLKLGSAASPTAGSRVLRFRAGGESGPVDVTVRLRQGGGDVLGAGTLVNEFAHPDLGALDLVEDEVTGDISDYSDLYVELVAG